MSQQDGTADEPLEGAEIGSLNRLSKPVIREPVDRRNMNFLRSAKNAAKEQYTSNTLAKRGTWRGIVLRIEPPDPEPTGWIARFFLPRGIAPPTVVKIKVRIPELHSSLPEPAVLGSSHVPSQRIINLYPTFEAQDDTVPVPAVGTVVNLDFDDKQNHEGAKFLGAVGQQTPQLGAEGVASAAAYANACGVGGPAAAAPGGAPLGTGAGASSFPVGELPGGRTGAGPWYERPSGLGGVTSITIHSTAGHHYDNPSDGIQSWINHGHRVGGRSYTPPRFDDDGAEELTRGPVGTNFIILGAERGGTTEHDGHVVLLAPPENYGPWHGGHMNRISVGIDLVGHPGEEGYPHTQKQFDSLLKIITSRELKDLAIIGHRHHSSNRSDPGHHFDNKPNNLNFNFAHPDIWPRTISQISGLDATGAPVDGAERIEHDVRGKVGPSKELGHQPLVDINERLKGGDRKGATAGGHSYLDGGAYPHGFTNASTQYIESFGGTLAERDTTADSDRMAAAMAIMVANAITTDRVAIMRGFVEGASPDQGHIGAESPRWHTHVFNMEHAAGSSDARASNAMSIVIKTRDGDHPLVSSTVFANPTGYSVSGFTLPFGALGVAFPGEHPVFFSARHPDCATGQRCNYAVVETLPVDNRYPTEAEIGRVQRVTFAPNMQTVLDSDISTFDPASSRNWLTHEP